MADEDPPIDAESSGVAWAGLMLAVTTLRYLTHSKRLTEDELHHILDTALVLLDAEQMDRPNDQGMHAARHALDGIIKGFFPRKGPPGR